MIQRQRKIGLGENDASPIAQLTPHLPNRRRRKLSRLVWSAVVCFGGVLLLTRRNPFYSVSYQTMELHGDTLTATDSSMNKKNVPPDHQEDKSTSRQQDCQATRYPLYDHLQVSKASSNNNNAQPRILCFVMTHSGYHATRVAAVWKTWGPKCDKLIVSSNVTDQSLNALAIHSDGSYLGLWDKLNATLRHIQQTYFASNADGPPFDFDWIFKADDDTFLIMENLKTYLANISVQPDKPTILGRRYSSPRYRNLMHKNTYFNHSSNRAFGKRFLQKVNKNKPVFYNYGGAGYAMNPAYLQKMVSVLASADTIRDSQPPEDQALGVVMAYQDIWPKSTLDEMGRNRFHLEAPWTMYDPPEDALHRFNQAQKAAGIWKSGFDCCAPESITFHHLSPKAMLELHHQLYYECRMDE